jgi:hypothetical protein
MKRKFLIGIILLAIFLFTACVNLRTIKIPEEYCGAGNKIVVVPIESGPVNAYRASLNIEVMLNDLTGASGVDALKILILGTLVDWRPETSLCEKLSEELARRGKTVIQNSETIFFPNNIRESKQWYNPDTTVFDHSEIINRYHPAAIMEASYEGMMIFASKTLTVFLVKVVDPNTGKVIARYRTVKNLKRADYNLKDPVQRRMYVYNFKLDFENEVTKAVPQLLDKLGF